MVMQEGFIFSDTLRQNIIASNETPNDERLNFAVNAANLPDLIQNLPVVWKQKSGVRAWA